MSLAVVIPTYNSAKFIVRTVMTIIEKCAILGLEEIIVVNDGSSDGTTSKIKEARHLVPNVNIRLIEMRVNVGQTNATAVGLSKVKSDFALTVDDDLKDDLSSAIDLLTKLKQEDLDFVVGAPNYRVNGRLRAIASEVVRRVAVRLYKTPDEFRFSSFCAYSKEFITASQLSDHTGLELGWMFLITKKYSNVKTGVQQGLRENSNYSFRGLFKASNPYRQYLTQRQMIVMGWLCQLVILSSTVMTLIFVLRYFLTGKILPGFTSLYLLGLLNLGFSGLIGNMVFQAKLREKVQLDIRSYSRER